MPNGQGPRSRVLGVSEVFDVLVGERVVSRAARAIARGHGRDPRDGYALTWSAFDKWMEEGEVVYTHPRSPFVRVDALASSRPITVRFNGAIVTETHRPVVVYGTGVVPRWTGCLLAGEERRVRGRRRRSEDRWVLVLTPCASCEGSIAAARRVP